MTLSTVNAHDVTKLSALTTDLGDDYGSSLTITAHSEDHQGKHRAEFVVFSDTIPLAEFERIADAIKAGSNLVAALQEAREFIADELEVRSASFEKDEPDHANYVAPVERLLATIDAAVAAAQAKE